MHHPIRERERDGGGGEGEGGGTANDRGVSSATKARSFRSRLYSLAFLLVVCFFLLSPLSQSQLALINIVFNCS